MLRTFRSKVLFTLSIFIVCGFGGLYFIISNGYNKMVTKEGMNIAQMLGESVFQIVRMSMNIGIREIMDSGIDDARNIDGIESVKIYKSKLVEEMYGNPNKESIPQDVEDIFKSRQQFIGSDSKGDGFILKKPLIANESCLQCHANAKDGDVLGVLDLNVSLSSMYHQINETQKYLLITMIVAGILALVGLYIFFERELVKPLNRLQDMTRDLTEGGSGDLTKRISIKSRDEIGITSSYVNKFIETIQSTISLSKGVSKENTLACMRLSEIAEILSKNSKEQFLLVDKVHILASEVSKQLEIVGETTSHTINDINETGDTLEQFTINLQDSVKLIAQLAQIQEEAVGNVEDLTKHANHIRDVISIINDISIQTNVLALNASIEAARAGEHGRSFAVVADEVKNLADKTQKSLNEISGNISLVMQSINDVQQTIMDVANSMRDITNTTEPLIEDAHNTKEKLKITKDKSLTLQDINMAMEKSTKDLNAMMQDITQRSESTQEVGYNIHNVAHEMTKKARELEESISKFKT